MASAFSDVKHVVDDATGQRRGVVVGQPPVMDAHFGSSHGGIEGWGQGQSMPSLYGPVCTGLWREEGQRHARFARWQREYDPTGGGLTGFAELLETQAWCVHTTCSVVCLICPSSTVVSYDIAV